MAEFLVLLLFPALIITAAVTDIFTMKISNWISLILIASFALTAWMTGMSGSLLLSHLAGGGLVLAVGFGLFCFGLIGGGDAKFLASVSLWFGLHDILPLILVTTLLGGPLCVFLIYMRKFPLPNWVAGEEWAERLHKKDSGAPYGVAISAAALILYAETPIMRTLGT
ncbi:MAG: A24 family peptidase [Hyphomicrobiales bacterium]